MFRLSSLRTVARPTLRNIAATPQKYTPNLIPLSVKYFSSTPVTCKTNTSTRTKENVHDLETFLTLIGRNCIEHAEAFENDLEKFLNTSSKEMKALGIDIQTRKYMLRWINKFQNDLEPLREHRQGKKKNGGERNSKEVLAKRRALARLEDRERFEKGELEAEDKGERVF
ncbi:protein Fyv4p, mitochondrial [[Candida] railenensis]|uniref:Small ribosomal subunit protein mS41 n=1 Tax=[Candida] railenensis TaxID=45579 RepID=A0A9P0QPS7_9ASCO|nr:protein Fyv4p, mitochondrial [[Candida] railenensis]